MNLTRGRFHVGDVPLTVEGYIGGTWNGWQCPLVEHDQLPVVAALLSDENCRYEVTEDGLLGHTVSGLCGEPRVHLVFAERFVCADGVTRMLYDVSLGCCWETEGVDS